MRPNVDAMFERNAFDPAQIFTPQGDYAAMQCRKPCGRVVWPSQPAVDRVLAHVDSDAFEVTGAGFNTPTVVRWQMERLAQVSPLARLVRINRDEADLGDAPSGRALAVPGDAGDVIEALARTCG